MFSFTSLHFDYTGFLIACVFTCARVPYEICQPPPLHAGMRNRRRISTTPRARRCGRTLHALTRQPPPEQSAPPPSAAQNSATLCHMVPCCFPLACGSRSRWRTGEGGENNCGHGWRASAHSSATEPKTKRTMVRVRLSTCAHLEPPRTALMAAVCVITASRWAVVPPTEGPWSPKTEPGPVEPPISMMAATLI